MRIFTYYHAPRRDWGGEALFMLETWEREWARNGWIPVVLGPHDLTSQAVDFHARTTRKLPSVNGNVYENACWERWSAVAAAARRRPAVMADWDVLPFGFRPEHLRVAGANHAAGGFSLLHEGIMPSFLHGWGAAWDDVVDSMGDAILTAPVTINGEPHVSDMHLFERWAGSHRAKPFLINLPPVVCRYYRGRDSTRGAQVVHFANDMVKQHAPGVRRVDLLRSILARGCVSCR